MHGVRVEVEFNEGTPLLTIKAFCEACGQLVTSRTINVDVFDPGNAPTIGLADAQAMVEHLKTCKGAPQ